MTPGFYFCSVEGVDGSRLLSIEGYVDCVLEALRLSLYHWPPHPRLEGTLPRIKIEAR